MDPRMMEVTKHRCGLGVKISRILQAEMIFLLFCNIKKSRLHTIYPRPFPSPRFPKNINNLPEFHCNRWTKEHTALDGGQHRTTGLVILADIGCLVLWLGDAGSTEQGRAGREAEAETVHKPRSIPPTVRSLFFGGDSAAAKQLRPLSIWDFADFWVIFRFKFFQIFSFSRWYRALTAQPAQYNTAPGTMAKKKQQHRRP